MKVEGWHEKAPALVLSKLQGAHLRPRGGGRHLQSDLRPVRSKNTAYSRRKKDI